MRDFPNPWFNVQDGQEADAPPVYRCPFTLYDSGHANPVESGPGQDVGLEFVNDNELLGGEDDAIYNDPLLRSLDELLSGVGPEPGGVEGVADDRIRVGGVSPDSGTEEAVDLRPNGDRGDSVFDRYFETFMEFVMEEANPIEEFGGEEWVGFNNGSHYPDMPEFESFEGSSSRFSAPQEQQEPSENFSRPDIEIVLPPDIPFTLNMEIDGAESSSSLLTAEWDQESSSIFLTEFLFPHDSRISDVELNIELEGTESSSSLPDLEADQQLSEDSPRDLQANSFDLDVEIERIMPSTPLSAIEEELDILGELWTTTSQTLWDASYRLTSMDHSLPFGLTNGTISMPVVGNENDLMVGMIPAAKRVVENLPVVKVGKEDLKDGSALVCAVCTNEIVEEEMVNRLPCWHYYHGECILPWLRVKNTCPLCRYELPAEF